MLLLTRFDVHALKSTQSFQRCAVDLWKRDVELNNLIAIALTSIFHVYVNIHGSARLQLRIRELHATVLECRVTEAMTEPIKGLTGEVPIGAVLHRVVVKARQLLCSLIERDRQSARRIIYSGQGLSDRGTTFFS